MSQHDGFCRAVGAVVGCLACLCSAAVVAGPPAPWTAPPGQQRADLEQALRDLGSKLQSLREQVGTGTSGLTEDLYADAAIFHKGAAWALRYESELDPADAALVRKATERGNQRVEALAARRRPWSAIHGRVVRGYISAVDGSVQPYGVIVPPRYDSSKPMRLDVVLHGSTRPRGLSELKFMDRFDGGDTEADDRSADATRDYIELHPLGRVENCYRWAGETDVFEAIEAVCRQYNVDRNRIVLRGMSMGASGTWHLGLKHPDRFVAIGPYCGYVDTHRFSETPLENFVKVGPLPPYQEKTLHMLDSVDYAANAGIVPAIACMGEKDVFFQAHVIMGEAMRREGLEMVNLISPGTGHVIDPVTHREQMRRIGQYAAKGLNHAPSHIRFVTWTLKYSRCHWIDVLGLEEHYRRAELEARVADDGTLDVEAPKNITRFAILPPVLQGASPRLRVAGAQIALPERAADDGARSFVVARRDGTWQYLGNMESVSLDGKRPGLQGPIDDAFSTPFLCVRGTGKPWNPAVAAWSQAALERFSYEWNRYFRGELPVKDDVEVTEADLARFNLILFGDPGSNMWMRKLLPKLPIEWTPDSLVVAAQRYAARDHAPVLIQPNPLPGAEGRYVVLNSGHTFHEKELSTLNYLLFPRLGDWAVIKLGAGAARNVEALPDEQVVRAGICDEHWMIGREAAE